MPYKIEGTTNTNADLVVIKESDWSVEKTMEITSAEAFLAKPLVSGTKTIFGKRPDGEVVGYGIIDPVFYTFEYPRSITNSAMLEADTSDYFSKTLSAPTSDQKGIISLWVKYSGMSEKEMFMGQWSGAGNMCRIGIEEGKIYMYQDESSGTEINVGATGVEFYRDPTGWTHFVFAIDSTQPVQVDRLKGWANNREINFVSTTFTQNINIRLFTNGLSQLLGYGHSTGGTPWLFDGYMSEYIYLDGQTHADPPSLFGEFYNEVWVPKQSLSGLTYGNNGFKLDFSNSSSLGDDTSGNYNNYASGGSPVQTPDSPTNNWPTLNSIDYAGGVGVTSYGNLKFMYDAAAYNGRRSTFPIPSSGKWYLECLVSEITGGSSLFDWGVVADDYSLILGPAAGNKMWGMQGYTNSGLYTAGVYQGNTTTTIAAGSILQMAIDVDNGKLFLGVNNSWWDLSQGTTGNPSTGANPSADSLDFSVLHIMLQLWSVTPPYTVSFGQLTLNAGGNADANGIGDFEYAPPTGYLAICSQNITSTISITDVIDKPSEAVYVNHRSGTSDTTKDITDVGFDVSAGALVTVKSTNTAATPWQVSDTERGVNKQLNYDNSNPQSSETDRITAFSSDGYTVGNNAYINGSGKSFMDWVVRKGSDYGLDVIEYTGTGAGRTISHNLGSAPTMMWVKNLAQGYPFTVYHRLCASNSEAYFGILAEVNAFANDTTMWNNTTPTSSVFSLGTHVYVNTNNIDHVAYLFADVPGYCKAFVYKGNGNFDGPYIPLGFRPKCWMIKSINTSRNWNLQDSVQTPANYIQKSLQLDLPIAQNDNVNYTMDVCAQGLKVRTNSPYNNDGGVLLIGFAWAEQFGPFSNAR